MSKPPNDCASLREAPQTPDPPGYDTAFLVMLTILAVLEVVLWFADPAHLPHGQSRVDWPGKTGVKP